MTPRNAIRAAIALILIVLAGHASADGAWIADDKGCKIWDPNPRPNESVTWSGACANGYAEGSGTLQWSVDGALSSTFEGNLSGGKPNGKAKESAAKGVSFEGDYVDGLRQGKGTVVFADGARYEGDFADGKRTGKGAITFKNGNHYEGDFVDGKLTGNGVYTWADGTRYTGYMINGAATGKGAMKFASGDNYEGDFANGKRTGKGIYTWVSGERYEGDFVDGRQEGKGLTVKVNGERYEGDFVNGKREGKGINIKANGDRYEGSFANGEFDGFGTMQYASGTRYEGYWKAGKYDGKGKIISLKFAIEGEYKAGNPIGAPKMLFDRPASVDITGCGPSYSKEALDAKEAGIARVQFELDADGKLLSAKITQSTGFPDLDQATLAALSRCEFKAKVKDGKPLASTFSVDYEWKPIPPKVPTIITQLKEDEGVLLIDVLIVNVKNLDHPEQIRKQNGGEAGETKLRNLVTNKKYSPKYSVGVGIFVVPEGSYCLDSFSGAFISEGKRWDSYFHLCKGESIKVTKGVINNAGEWWIAHGQATDDDEYHAPFIPIGEFENSARTLQRAVNKHPELLED